MGASDLKMPERRLSKRDMPSSAAPITEGALKHPHVPIANSSGNAGSTSHFSSSSQSGHTYGLDGSSSTSYTSQQSSQSTTAQETSINTAINSSSSNITEADKPVFSTPDFSKVAGASVADKAVAADEVDMKKSESSSASKQENSSFFASSSTSNQGSSSFFSEDVVSPTQTTTTTKSDGKDFPGAFPSEPK